MATTNMCSFHWYDRNSRQIWRLDADDDSSEDDGDDDDGDEGVCGSNDDD